MDVGVIASTEWLIWFCIFIFAFVGESYQQTESDEVYSGLCYSFLLFFIVVYCYAFRFDAGFIGFQLCLNFSHYGGWAEYLVFGVDGCSAIFILLTVFLFPFCLFYSTSNIFVGKKLFVFIMFVVEFLLIFAFMALDVLFFFFFESVLVPVFVLIQLWGSQIGRVRAGVYFFVYTIFLSGLLLAGGVLLSVDSSTTGYFNLLFSNIPVKKQLLLWLFFFTALGCKVPIFPFHVWLPEAHVEATTIGSVLLAGLLLKLGGYGFLRYVVSLLPEANLFFWPVILGLSMFSVVYASFMAIRQIDIKKIIAYSSIVHMNIAIASLFSNTIIGVVGGVLLMFSHGVVSSALFYTVGLLYDRYHSRLLTSFGGLVVIMPVFVICLFVFTLSGIGFPGTAGFFGEIFCVYGILHISPLFSICVFISFFLAIVYSFFIYTKISFGPLVEIVRGPFLDLTLKEVMLALTLVFVILGYGVYVQVLINKVFYAVVFALI